MVGRVALAVVALGVALTGRAAAQPAELGIAWDVPASCPDAAALRTRVEQRLGRTLADVALDISISIAREHGRFVARVDLRALTVANDVRTLTSRRCDELADAVAVVIARVARDVEQARGPLARGPLARGPLARSGDRAPVISIVDRDAADAPQPPAPHTTSAARAGVPSSAASGDRTARARTAAAGVAGSADRDDDAADAAAPAIHAGVIAPPHRVWSIGARLSGVSGIGIVPRVGLGGELAVTVRHDTMLGELAETRWMKSAAQLHAGGPAHVDVDLSVTAVRAGWRSEQLPLRGWASVETGSMHGSGVALDNAQVGSGRWLAAGAGFGVAWQMTPWIRLVGSTEALIAFERVRFSLGDGAVVYAPSPLSVRTSCGIELGWQ